MYENVFKYIGKKSIAAKKELASIVKYYMKILNFIIFNIIDYKTPKCLFIYFNVQKCLQIY